MKRNSAYMVPTHVTAQNWGKEIKIVYTKL